MKKEIPVVYLIAAVVCVLAVVGYFAFTTFFKDPNSTPIQGAKEEKAYDDARSKDREMYRKIRTGASSATANR